MSNVVPEITLNNGYKMPGFALGTYKCLGNDCEEAIKHAIDVGYRHIDTAYLYQNEDVVGRAIRDKINEGVVKREDLFIVTKLWCTYHEEHLVEKACRLSLEKLGLDYIDLYLIHSPIGMTYKGDDVLIPKKSDGSTEYNDVDYIDTWRGMENLVKLGLTKSIGVSNFSSEQILRILAMCEIKPVNNQVECSINLNQKRLINFCKENDIVLTAYSPLGRPDPIKKTPDFIFDSRVIEISKKYNKTTAQVALRYLTQIGAIPLPKSVTKSRIEENIKIFDFQLNDEDMNVLESFNNGHRIVRFDIPHKYNPLNVEF